MGFNTFWKISFLLADLTPAKPQPSFVFFYRVLQCFLSLLQAMNISMSRAQLLSFLWNKNFKYVFAIFNWETICRLDNTQSYVRVHFGKLQPHCRWKTNNAIFIRLCMSSENQTPSCICLSLVAFFCVLREK